MKAKELGKKYQSQKEKEQQQKNIFVLHMHYHAYVIHRVNIVTKK